MLLGIIYHVAFAEWHFPTQHNSFRDPQKWAHALISETSVLPNPLAPEVLGEGLWSCLLPKSWDGRSQDAWLETSSSSVRCTKAMPATHMTFTRVCSPLFCIHNHLPPLLCLDYSSLCFPSGISKSSL